MATLPRNGSTTGHKNSLTRHLQLITALETHHNSRLGNGVVSGGDFSIVSGYTGQIATGTVLSCEGYLHTLTATQNYTAAEASTTVYIWGIVTRTAADYTSGVAVDTYTLTITHNLTGASPGTGYFPLSVWTTDGSGITAIADPGDKYVRLLGGMGTVRTRIGTAESALVPADHQVIIYEGFSVEGSGALTVGGLIRVID
jgi:hypothetical protein